MMIVVFIVWFIYTFKSWQYIRRQLYLESNLFIFYSVTSFSRQKQFQSWVVVQTAILLPALAYALLTLIVGITFGYPLAPFIVLGYIVLLILLSATIYIRLTDQLAEVQSNYILRITRNRSKPLFTLFLFHIVDQQKLTYLVTKAMTLFCIVSLSYFFADATDLRAPGIIMLLVSITHVVIIFQQFRFEQLYLAFVRNFPISRTRLYIHCIGLYALLLLPEGIALYVAYPITTALLLLVFTLSIVMIFRCMLPVIRVTMRNYLWCVTVMSVVIFIAILFRQMEWVALLGIPVSGFLFYSRYYRMEPLAL